MSVIDDPLSAPGLFTAPPVDRLALLVGHVGFDGGEIRAGKDDETNGWDLCCGVVRNQ